MTVITLCLAVELFCINNMGYIARLLIMMPSSACAQFFYGWPKSHYSDDISLFEIIFFIALILALVIAGFVFTKKSSSNTNQRIDLVDDEKTE